MKSRLFVTCLVVLNGTAYAYDASFGEALDQPGRAFTGSGWQIASAQYAPDGIDAVGTESGFGPPKTFATEVSGPSGVRFEARVPGAIMGADAPVSLTVDGPDGLTRPMVPGTAGKVYFMTPSAGAVTWTAIVHYPQAMSAYVDQLEIFDPVLPAAVGQALDRPGMAFLSAAPEPWVLTNTDTHDGEDALTTNGGYTDFQVTAPAGMNAVSFWAKTSGHPESTLKLIFSGNDIEPAWTSEGTTGWQRVTRMLPSSGATVRWLYRRGGTEGALPVRIDGVEFTSVSALQDAIDLVEPVFNVPAGAQPFSRITTDSRDGVDAAQSAPGAATSVMRSTVTGPAVLSWDSRISAAGASLEVQVDQADPWVCRDTTAWAHHAVFIPAGSHTVRFTASDSSGGSATARVDQAKVTPWYGEVYGSGLTFTQSGTAGWERMTGIAGSWTTAAGFVTGDRTGIPDFPDEMSPVLSATASGPGWLSYRSSVTTAAANASTLETPVPGQNHTSSTRVVSMAFPEAGPHALTWALRGTTAGAALQQASVTDLKWTEGSHPLGHPGPWVLSDDKVWDHTGKAEIKWGSSTGNRSATISTKFTGPGSLNFSWSCKASRYLFGFTGSLTVSVSGGQSLTVPMDTSSFPTGPAAAAIPLPGGEQTVTWKLDSSNTYAEFDFPPAVTASIQNFSVVNPFASAMEALDTTLPLSSLSGTWVLENGAGWRGGDCLAVNTGSGTLSLQITGPATLAFRGAVTGPYNPSEFGPKFTATGSPGGGSMYFMPFIAGASVYHELRALVFPAGTHTATFHASAAPPPVSGYPPVTWKMDALEAFVPADYAVALNNGYAWTVSANSGFAPVPQSAETHDGSKAVGFYYQNVFSQPGLSSLTTANVNGPGLISWWQKGSLRLTVDGNEAAVSDTGTLWSRRTVRLSAGAHMLTWAGTGQNAAWLDEVKAGSAFENWMAGYLTDAQLSDAANFSGSSDVDGDELSALVEYALQTSPVVPSRDRAPVLIRDGADATLLHFTWRQPQSLSGVTLAPQISSDLATWTYVEAEQTGTAGSDALMRASIRTSSGGSARFVRLEVRLVE